MSRNWQMSLENIGTAMQGSFQKIEASQGAFGRGNQHSTSYIKRKMDTVRNCPAMVWACFGTNEMPLSSEIVKNEL